MTLDQFHFFSNIAIVNKHKLVIKQKKGSVMEWKEYESKKRFRRVITNTFSSNEDCEMFIMVLKQQWPKHINKLPDSELEITRSIESPNIMSAMWTLKDYKHFEVLQKIGNEIIYPYRNKLSPKTTSIETESLCKISAS